MCRILILCTLVRVVDKPTMFGPVLDLESLNGLSGPYTYKNFSFCENVVLECAICEATENFSTKAYF